MEKNKKTQINEKIQTILKKISNSNNLKKLAKQALPLIDLTSLNLEDTEKHITILCQQALTLHGTVAAVCIYPQFVKLAKTLLKETLVKVATVSNFPKGDEPIDLVISQIQQSLKDGADEIDLVWPYTLFLAGNEEEALEHIRAAKKICQHQAILKIILETGKLLDTYTIYRVSRLMIDAGADFLKTSTGKIEINATPEAAAAMLLAIKDSKKPVGFKASGGIREVKQAAVYISIAEDIMGKNWITPQTFRFGASGLLKDILKQWQS